jgi:hypothetical protein
MFASVLMFATLAVIGVWPTVFRAERTRPRLALARNRARARHLRK